MSTTTILIWIWSWLRKCLRPRYWSWIHRFLRPMNLILTEVMFATKILVLTKGMSRASHPRHQVVACKSQNLELVSNWWVFCCSLVFLFFSLLFFFFGNVWFSFIPSWFELYRENFDWQKILFLRNIWFFEAWKFWSWNLKFWDYGNWNFEI